MKPEKQINLLAFSILAVSLFFMLPRNRAWLHDKILPYFKAVPRQLGQLDTEQRKTERYGNAYRYSTSIASTLRKRTEAGKVLLLMPSTSYFKARGLDYPVPEPAVFYYYTGIKTVWSNSSEAMGANWYAHVAGGQIQVDSVAAPTQLRDTISSFNKFPVSL